MPAHPGDCKFCGGTGFRIRQVDGYDRAAPCPCRTAALGRRRETSVRIPPRYRHCEVANFEVHSDSQREARRRALDFVEAYPPADRSGILFSGSCGVGKTHLAVGILRQLVDAKGVAGLFVDFRELLKELQRTYHPDHPLSAYQVLAPIFAAEVLLLDDLGASKMTDWVRDTLGHIINRRYNQERITLFTTNFPEQDAGEEHDDPLAPETLASRIGVPLRSRLDEMCQVIEIHGPDYRRTFLRAADRW
jgi:DNA replication protein DnaC